MSSQTCEISPKVQELMLALRFRKAKTNAALVLKIDPNTLLVVNDGAEGLLEDVSIEELAVDLPPSTPRFLLLSYTYHHRNDGRISYPLIGIYYNPAASNPKHRMLYASTTTLLFGEAQVTGKVFGLSQAEDLTPAWLDQQLEGSMTRP